MADVSGVAASNFVLQNQTDLKSRVQELRIEASTGKKSQTYDGIANDASRLQRLESDFSANKAFQRNSERTLTRLKEMESSISTLQDVASQFRTDLLSAANDGGNLESIDLGTIARTFRDEAQGVLNTELGGRSLFAGSATNTQTVSFENVSNVSDIKAGRYFQGNDEVLSARVTQQTTIEYGVTADVANGSGAQKLLTAIQRVIDAPNSEEAVEQSIRDITGGEADVVLKKFGGNTIQDPTKTLNQQEGGDLPDGQFDISVSASGPGSGSSTTVDTTSQSLADVARELSNGTVSARVANQQGDVQLEIFSNDDSTELDASVSLGSGTPPPPNINPTVSKQQNVQVDGAIAELADTRSAIGSTRSLVDTTTSQLKDDETRLNNNISDIEDIELEQTLTRLADNQQSLQASFATTSRLQQTTILNFLN